MEVADNVAVKVVKLGKTFRLPHEKQSSLKSTVINFRKRGYELQKALDNVTLEIKKGEFFAIIGRNGSGKSTLLKLLAGIYMPSKGEVKINGSLTPFIELGVGFNPELTGRENVYLNGALLGFNRKQMRAMYEDIVKFAELERFMDQRLKNYSSGMQVRLAFSIAIRAQSDILLIDEVLAVGDAAFQNKCLKYFETVKQKGKTVVLVTHDMSNVRNLCNRAALITNGKLEYVGDTSYAAELYDKQNASGVLNDEKTTVNLGDAEIESIKLKNNKKEGYLPEDTIELEAVVRAKKATEVFLGLQLMKADGQFVAGIASHPKLEPQKLGPGKKYTYEFKFASSQLAGGDYMIDGVLFKPGRNGPIFNRQSMARFSTIGERGWGSLNLQGKWKKLD